MALSFLKARRKNMSRSDEAHSGFLSGLPASSISPVTSWTDSAAFFDVITGLRLAGLGLGGFSRIPGYFAATLLHRLAFAKGVGLLYHGDLRCCASASILSTNSRSVILSRRFSFFKPLRFLYCRVVMPDHALNTSSVKIAYSRPLAVIFNC